MIRECSWLIVTTKAWGIRQTNGAGRRSSEKIGKDIKRAYRCPAVDTAASIRGAQTIFFKIKDQDRLRWRAMPAIGQRRKLHI